MSSDQLFFFQKIILLKYIKYFFKVLVFSVIFTTSLNVLGFLLISIPKAGTNLMVRVVEKIFKRDVVVVSPHSCSDNNFIEPSLKDLERVITGYYHKPVHSHLYHSPQYEAMLYKNNIRILFMIRDPRDQAVSSAFWIKNRPNDFPECINFSLKDILAMNIINIQEFYNLWLPWKDYYYALAVRFEDLVGSRGGGSDVRQVQTVKNMANHFNRPISQARAVVIARDLFGNTNTFRKGQIGSWREHFTQKNIEDFKLYGGQLLIDLGYEKDLNW